MNLYKCYLVANACYQTGTAMKPQGIVVHSTGANNPYLSRTVQPLDNQTSGITDDWEYLKALLGTNKYGNHWNQYHPDGREVCVHGFIGKLADGTVATVQTLPFDIRCWGCGAGANGSNNATHIQFEICEDDLTDREYFDSVIKESTEFCAFLCREYDIPVENIVSHRESYLQGKGSNHGDIDHWLERFGMSMDGYRNIVNSKLKEDISMTDAEKTEFDKLKSTVEQQAELINKLLNRTELIKEKYNYFVDIPDYAKPTFKRLIDAGIIKGKDDGKLHLTDDHVRIMVELERKGEKA